ncbi:macrolide 2'-phosphotransferase [Tropheryma whipplei]|uniref:macrolide 2'-phosphotransferase n=2 Tax=Tropheryma whipplei TaxID=2039 RepID=UPI00057159B1|nr:macrolide 2'-phosphotransferase [Tropheryma whipplei]
MSIISHQKHCQYLRGCALNSQKSLSLLRVMIALSPMSMAAVAVATLPNLNVLQVARGTSDSHHVDSILRCDDNRWMLIRVPLSQNAKDKMARLVKNLRALSKGVRARLPFSIPNVLAYQPVKLSSGMNMTLIMDHPQGYALRDIKPGEGAATSIGCAIAAIHNLPSGLLISAGYTHKTAQDCRYEVIDFVDKANATNMLPGSLKEKWETLVEDEDLWKFQTTVVKKNFSMDSFRFQDNQEGGSSVCAILEWEDASIDDPAYDLHWLNQLSHESAESILKAYEAFSTTTHDRGCLERAKLYAELDIARILIDGVREEKHELIDMAKRLLLELDRTSAQEDTPKQAIHKAEGLLENAQNLSFEQQRSYEIQSDDVNAYSDEETYKSDQVSDSGISENLRNIEEFLGSAKTNTEEENSEAKNE